MSTTFYCDCEQYCDGKRRQVSKTTFYFHKRKRDPLSHFSASMQTFLKDKPVTTSTSPLSTPSQWSHKQGNDATNHIGSTSQCHGLLYPGRGSIGSQVSVVTCARSMQTILHQQSRSRQQTGDTKSATSACPRSRNMPHVRNFLCRS